MRSNLPMGANSHLRYLENLDRLEENAWDLVTKSPDVFNDFYNTELSPADWRVLLDEDVIGGRILDHLQGVVYERLRYGG